jgi:putative CocE/NonD family hydrolase
MHIILEKNVPVPMRDGVKLATDVYRPAEGGPVPVLLMRLPYSKESMIWTGWVGNVQQYVQAGYAVVIQDTRGRFASEGEFLPYVHEAADGVDTIAWAASQRWSNDVVGTIGGSYLAAVQWLTAIQRPEALRAIAPAIFGDSQYTIYYQGGAYLLSKNLNWILDAITLPELPIRMSKGQASTADIEAVTQALENIDALFEYLPLGEIPLMRDLAPFFSTSLEHPTDDEYWQSFSAKEKYEQITAPALNLGVV